MSNCKMYMTPRKKKRSWKNFITSWFVSSLPSLCQKDIGCHSSEGIPLFFGALQDTKSQNYLVVWKMLTAHLGNKPCRGLAIFLGFLASLPNQSPWNCRICFSSPQTNFKIKALKFIPAKQNILFSIMILKTHFKM